MVYPKFASVVCSFIGALAVQFTLLGCTSVPASDFYEVDGIVSIYAVNTLTIGNEATHIHGTLESAKLSHSNISDNILNFPFFLQNAGSYEIWFLAKKERSTGSDPVELQIEITDSENYLVHTSRASIEKGDLYQWVTASIDGLIDRSVLTSVGSYRVSVRVQPEQTVYVHKLHMTRDPENRPAGLGLPETNRFNMDPLLEKREQRIPLPPAWSFGVIKGDTDIYSEKLAEPIQNRINSKYEGSEVRKLPVMPDVGQFNVIGLKEHIEVVSNPLLATYELPFAFYPSDLSRPDIVSTMAKEEKLHWLQFQTFNSVMNIFSPEYMSQLITIPASEAEPEIVLYNHIEELITLRKKLFPYIYSLAHLAGTSGERPVRGEANHPFQFRLGEAFLLVPLYENLSDDRFVYLPNGLWYENSTGRLYDGGQAWLIETPVNDLPLFRRAGSIVPYRMENDIRGDKTLSGYNHRLAIEIAAGAPGTFRLYEDDGMTTNYTKGEFSTTAFRYFEHEDHATFTIGRMVGGFTGQSEEKELKVIFKYVEKPMSVIVNETVLTEGSNMNQWYFDSENQQLIVKWIQSNRLKSDFIIHY